MNKATYFTAGLLAGSLPFSIARASTQDAVAVSPQYYTIRFENDRVRVMEWRLKPGEREATHTHAPGIVYVLADSTVRTTFPDGTVAERPARAGEVFWRDATSHSLVNVGQTEAHTLAIDVKPCKP